MKELKQKYVLHIPNCKFQNNELVSIDIENLLDELIGLLNQNGHNSFYIQKSESHYKFRSYEETLITVFADTDEIEEIFSEWFEKNNHILQQEAYAFERNCSLVVKELR